MKEFFNRIWSAIKFASKMVLSLTVRPIYMLAKGESSGYAMLFHVVGTIARAVFIVSLFVTVPAWALIPATIWCVVSLRLHIIVTVIGVVFTLFTDNDFNEEVFGTDKKAANDDIVEPVAAAA